MARALDVTVVLAPPLRALFEGRRELSLGVPGGAGVGEVLEALFTLYPRARQLQAGDSPPTGGHYVQLALDSHALAELAAGGTGLSTGRRLFLFRLSRPSPGVPPGA